MPWPDVVLQDAQRLAGHRGHVVVHCAANVAHELARGEGRDPPPHGSLGDVGEALVLGVRGSHDHRAGRIGVPAVHDRAAVDRDDVAVLQDLGTRVTVDHFLVDGRADGGREAVVAKEVGLGARLESTAAKPSSSCFVVTPGTAAATAASRARLRTSPASCMVRIWAFVLYSMRGWPNAISGVSSQCGRRRPPGGQAPSG